MTTGSRAGRALRAGTAAALGIFVLALSPTSSAQPTREQIEEVEARLEELHQQQGLLVEEYDQTQVALEETRTRLADLRTVLERARAAQERAGARLNDAARAAYINQGSTLDLLLSSESFSVLSDRLYFLDGVARRQEEIAVRAAVAAHRARQAASKLQTVLEQQQVLVKRLEQQAAEIEAGIADQEAMLADLEVELRREIEARQRAQAEAQAAAPSAPQGPVSPNPPAVNGSGAAAAIAAAESVLGVPYQYGGASPQTGFDCSGLTMWAWAHAGVSLPHSSQMQYASLPHVGKDQLQPGDLVFFYSPIHHVGLYVGGGMMIHAPHTGTVVSKVPVYWEYFVGAARPG